MASESEFSKTFIRGLDGAYYFHRVETRFAGLPDISYLSRTTAQGGWIETKFSPTKPLRGEVTIPVKIEQALFLRKWASIHTDAKAFIFFSSMDKDFYFFRATPDVAWTTAIRQPLTEENLQYLKPLHFEKSIDYKVLMDFIGR
jgi:hypothetical protein